MITLFYCLKSTYYGLLGYLFLISFWVFYIALRVEELFLVDFFDRGGFVGVIRIAELIKLKL